MKSLRKKDSETLMRNIERLSQLSEQDGTPIAKFRSLGLAFKPKERSFYLNFGYVEDPEFFEFALNGFLMLISGKDPGDPNGFVRTRPNAGGICIPCEFTNRLGRHEKVYMVFSRDYENPTERFFCQGHEETHAYFACGGNKERFRKAISREYNVNSSLFESLQPDGEEMAHLGGFLALYRQGLFLEDYLGRCLETNLLPSPEQFMRALDVVRT